jgi:hypothetical protein
MPMVFALQASAKDVVDEKCTILLQQAEELRRKQEEEANLAEVVCSTRSFSCLLTSRRETSLAHWSRPSPLLRGTPLSCARSRPLASRTSLLSVRSRRAG